MGVVTKNPRTSVPVDQVTLASSGNRINPQARLAMKLHMEGNTITAIAQRLGRHRKTISRWLKVCRQQACISTDDNTYRQIVLNALEEYGQQEKLYRMLSIRNYVAGDLTSSYAAIRAATTLQKQRQKALGRFGLDTRPCEQENVKLKHLAAWALILAGRFEQNQLALENNDFLPWPEPYNIQQSEIEAYRKCPELLQSETYFVERPPQPYKYVTAADLEMLTTIRTISDPLFEMSADIGLL